MKSLEKLKEMLCEELEKIGKKGELSAGMLETVHKLTDTIKNIDKIEMLEEDGEYSEAGNWMGEGRMYGTSYARGGRGRGRNAKRDSMGRYSREGGYSEDGYSEEGGSYRRSERSYASGAGGSGGGSSYARGDHGGSSRRGGYSYDGAKDYMIEQMEEMMEMAESEQERKAIQQCIQKLEQA